MWKYLTSVKCWDKCWARYSWDRCWAQYSANTEGLQSLLLAYDDVYQNKFCSSRVEIGPFCFCNNLQVTLLANAEQVFTCTLNTEDSRTTSYFSAIHVYKNFVELWNVYILIEITGTAACFCLLFSLAKNILLLKILLSSLILLPFGFISEPEAYCTEIA